jgi:hypothetical protein
LVVCKGIIDAHGGKIWLDKSYRGGAAIKFMLRSSEFGILDHVFIDGGLEWHVFVRIIPNEDGSTVT